LLLYTGAAIVGGIDMFLAAIVDDLHEANAHYSYREVDPDVFSEELLKPAYATVERIAAIRPARQNVSGAQTPSDAH